MKNGKSKPKKKKGDAIHALIRGKAREVKALMSKLKRHGLGGRMGAKLAKKCEEASRDVGLAFAIRMRMLERNW